MELHAILHQQGVAHWCQEAVFNSNHDTKRILRALYIQGSALLMSATAHQQPGFNRLRQTCCAMLGTSEDTARHVHGCCPLGKDVSNNFVLNKKRRERGYLLMKMSPPPAHPRGWASERLQIAPPGFPEQEEGNAECKLFQCLS